MDINKYFENGNELLDQLSGPALGTFLMAASLAAGDQKVKFRSAYCSEYDTNELTAGQIHNMPEPVVSTTVNLFHPSGKYKGKYYGYVCIDIGVNWFSWGIGDPLMSALCEYFVCDGFVAPDATPCERCTTGEVTEEYLGKNVCDTCAHEMWEENNKREPLSHPSEMLDPEANK